MIISRSVDHSSWRTLQDAHACSQIQQPHKCTIEENTTKRGKCAYVIMKLKQL